MAYRRAKRFLASESMRIKLNARRGALYISLFYFGLGGLWITFSDRVAEALFPDPRTYIWVQTFKGWGYVLMTALGLYRLIRHQLDQIATTLEARDVFTAVASHELRTPLTALELQLALMKKELSHPSPAPELRDRIDPCVGTITRQVKRLSRLVDDLMDLQKFRSGKELQYHFEEVDLSLLLRYCLDDLTPILTSSGSEMNFEIAPDIHIRADRERIAQVISNLINNAVKFGEGKPIEARLSRHRKSGNDYARLIVSDQGIGIDQKDRARIFMPFERAVSEKSYGGLGLGLFISTQIIRSHHGFLQVLAPEAQKHASGTQFEVLLPMSKHVVAAPTADPAM